MRSTGAGGQRWQIKQRIGRDKAYAGFVLAMLRVMFVSAVLIGNTTAQSLPTSKNSSCGPVTTPKFDSLNALASDNELIYFSSPGEITAYSPSLGTIQWVTSIPQTEFVSVSVDAERILIAIDDGSGATLMLLDRATGLIARRIRIPEARISSIAAKNQFAVLHSGISLFISDLGREGTEPMKISFDSSVLHSQITEDYRLFVITAGAIETIDLRNPALRTSLRGDFSNLTAAAVIPEGIVTGTTDGTISLLRGVDIARKWRFRAGGRVSSIRRVGEDLLVSSHDNFIYRLDADSGSVEWKKRIGGRILHPPGVSPEFVFVTDTSSGFAETVDLRSGRTVIKFKLGDDVVPTLAPVSVGKNFLVATNAGLFGFRTDECK